MFLIFTAENLTLPQQSSAKTSFFVSTDRIVETDASKRNTKLSDIMR